MSEKVKKVEVPEIEISDEQKFLNLYCEAPIRLRPSRGGPKKKVRKKLVETSIIFNGTKDSFETGIELLLKALGWDALTEVTMSVETGEIILRVVAAKRGE